MSYGPGEPLGDWRLDPPDEDDQDDDDAEPCYGRFDDGAAWCAYWYGV